jgi:exopolysaccharide biosynthesis protein
VEILLHLSQIINLNKINDMKRVFFILVALLTAAVAGAQDQDAVAFANAEWKVTELERGAQAMYAQVPMFNSVQSICVIKYPAKKFKTEILHRPGKEQADIPSKIGKEVGAAFALNAGYFDMKALTPTVYFRVGDEVYGQTHPTEEYRVDGVIALKNKKGTKVMIAKSTPAEYDEVAGKCHAVMATGPTLIIEDEIVVPVLMGNAADGANAAAAQEELKRSGKSSQHYSSAKFYDRRHPRTAIGTDSKGYIYLVVIDGRFPGQGDGATIWETAKICELLGMDNAINLDGGGSTTIWSETTGVINHPYDNRKFDHEGERKIPNMIVAY